MGPGQLVQVPFSTEAGEATPGDVVELTDDEGATVAQVPLAPEGDLLVPAETPTWLSARSSRPFEPLHVTGFPAGDGPDRLVVVDVVDIASLEQAVSGAGRVTVLALASLDGEPALAAAAGCAQDRDRAAPRR